MTEPTLICLSHLDRLSEIVTIDGEPCLLVHIYAEAPDYHWVDAVGEGLAAVDDVARAVLVYLHAWQRHGDQAALAKARAGLCFVLRMQTADGAFYNFVLDRAGTINRDGSTSRPLLHWWAYRALWAIARGWALLAAADPAFGARLRAAYLRTEQAIIGRLGGVGRWLEVHHCRVPAWLPNATGDASAVALLALAEYQAAAPNDRTRQAMIAIADGLSAYQPGGPGEYPWAMHPHALSEPGFWHAWGAHAAQALARAGALLGREDYLASARRELEIFFGWQLATERIHELGVLPLLDGQQIYGTSCLVQAALELYHATGDQRYARMAGLHAAWLFGNNVARAPVYDPLTGRGYDGIDDGRVSRNAGAESTIEALLALEALEQVPAARRYLQFRPVAQHGWQLLEAEAGRVVAGAPTFGRGGWTGEARWSGGGYCALGPGDAIELRLTVPRDDQYLLYVAHLRRAARLAPRRVAAAYAAVAPDLHEHPHQWAAAPALLLAADGEVLPATERWRPLPPGAALLRALWDEHGWYLLLDLRTIEQPSSLIEARLYGGTDELRAGWRLAARRDGPALLDPDGRALAGARVVGHALEGGQRYTLAIPWSGLGLDPSEVGGLRLALALQAAPASAALPLVLLPPELPRPAPPADPLRVALELRIDAADGWLVPQATAPDFDYLWLDPVGPGPLRLTAGAHTLRLRYAGSDPSGLAIVDGVLLHPLVATKTLRSPEGGALRLAFDLRAGSLAWHEAAGL